MPLAADSPFEHAAGVDLLRCTQGCAKREGASVVATTDRDDADAALLTVLAMSGYVVGGRSDSV